MKLEENKEEIKYLESLGFKRNEYPDDGFWMEMKLDDANYLKDCSIAIDEDIRNEDKSTIEVYTKDLDDNYIVRIISEDYDRFVLNRILDSLSS